MNSNLKHKLIITRNDKLEEQDVQLYVKEPPSYAGKIAKGSIRLQYFHSRFQGPMREGRKPFRENS
jgi:hypothetical protein